MKMAISGAVRELFDPINNTRYRDRDLAEQAIKLQFAKHRAKFDPEYSLYQLLKWSYRHGWIKEVEGEYIISIDFAEKY